MIKPLINPLKKITSELTPSRPVELLWSLSLGLLLFVSQLPQNAEASSPLIVVSGSRESSEIGLEILKQGGNAIDAAVAVSLALGVSEPYGSGLGGKLVLLYYQQESASVHVFEGLETAPSAFDPLAFRNLPDSRKHSGIASVGVPGTLAVLAEAHDAFGLKPWPDLVRPVITLAREGFEMTEAHQSVFKAAHHRILSGTGTVPLFTRNGLIPETGERLTNPHLADTLERIARNGASEFYSREGITAHLMVRFFERHGGNLRFEDLEAYHIRRPPPLEIPWAGYRFLSAPSPNAGGAIVGFTLLGMEALPPARFGSAAFYHHFSLSVRESYRLLREGFGDRVSPEQDQSRVLNPLFQKNFKQSVLRAHSQPPSPGTVEGLRNQTDEFEEDSTSHFIIMDAQGNVVSATQSLSSRFGNAAVVDGTGILLNNSLKNFAFFTPSSPNYAAPGLRPRSTISPSIVLEQDQFVLAIGSPAGQRIPTGVAQVLHAVLVDRIPVAEAIDFPRFHLRRALTRRESNRHAEFEPEIDTQVANDLAERGWDVHLVNTRFYFGGISAIHADRKTNQVFAVGDARRSNEVRRLDP